MFVNSFFWALFFFVLRGQYDQKKIESLNVQEKRWFEIMKSQDGSWSMNLSEISCQKTQNQLLMQTVILFIFKNFFTKKIVIPKSCV